MDLFDKPKTATDLKDQIGLFMGQVTRQIPSQEVLHDILIYEPETGKFYWKTRDKKYFGTGPRGTQESRAAIFNKRFAGKEAFAYIDTNGYHVGAIFNKNHVAHRIAWAFVHGAEFSGEIDHIDGDRANNRIANLRSVSKLENNKNQKRRKDCSSGITGVSFNKTLKKWVAYIGAGGKIKVLGYFADIDLAKAARQGAETQFGFHPNHGRAT